MINHRYDTVVIIDGCKHVISGQEWKSLHEKLYIYSKEPYILKHDALNWTI